MIDLTGKSVFVKTQEEYLSVLKIANLQGFTWARGDWNLNKEGEINEVKKGNIN
jgi:hypothetical protein